MTARNLDEAPEWLLTYLEAGREGCAALWWDEVIPGPLSLSSLPYYLVGLADEHGTILTLIRNEELRHEKVRGLPLGRVTVWSAMLGAWEVGHG